MKTQIDIGFFVILLVVVFWQGGNVVLFSVLFFLTNILLVRIRFYMNKNRDSRDRSA